MSYELDPTAVIAAIGLNDGANKGFWRIQPRDNEGQWIEMGAEVLAVLRGLRGNRAGVTARYVGPSGTVGKARILVDGDSDLADGIYEIDSHVLKQIKAILPEAYVKSQGAKGSQKKLAVSDADIPSIEDVAKTRTNITDEDRRLAKGELTDDEKTAQEEGRKESPIAEMPGGFESLKREEAKKLLEDSGVNPSEFEKASAKPTESDRIDGLVLDLMKDAFYGGDSPDVDTLIENALTTEPVEVSARDLKPGDIINLGKMGDKKVTRVDVKSSGMVDVYVDDYGTERKITKESIPGNAGIMRVAQAPAAPEKKPVSQKPEKPVAVKKPAPAAPKKPTTPADADRPLDDGELIPRQEFAEGEVAKLRETKLTGLTDPNGEAVLEYDADGKPYQPKDPNAMLNFLAKTYKDSKFNEQGQLVLMREISDENGKSIQWEIRAANTGDKKVAYLFHFKDLKTGEEQTVVHKDAHDSVQALFKKTRNSPTYGPETYADVLTGKQTPKYNKSFDLTQKFDPIERAGYFTVQGRTKSITDSAKYYAIGYADRFNPKDGTLLERAVPSVFAAFEEGDREATEDRLRAVFGRLPLDEQSHAEARQAIRELYAERNPEADKRSFGVLVSRASMSIREGLFSSPENRAIPYSSKDKVSQVQVGMTVEYTNNINEKSIVKVKALQKVNAAAPSQSNDVFEYGDYVTVVDANGKTTSLPTTSLAILKDQNTPLTEYKGIVRGRELREARGLTYRPSTLLFPGQSEVPDKIAKVDDLVPGDNFYSKAGDNLGVVVESVSISGKDGKKGYGILYINKDGDLKKVAVASGDSRGPKNLLSNNKETAPTAKKQILVDSDESDPDFDLDAVEFETDPDTVEKPKTVGLDFNVPVGAKRNAVEQLNLNDEVQAELDAMASDLTTALDGWAFDTSSFNAKTFFKSDAFSKLIAKARAEYPDLTDAEIRTLLELQHSKQRGFFGMTREKMIEQVLREAASFNKNDGSIRSLQVDVRLNKQTNKLELSLTPEERAQYLDALGDIEKFSSNVKLGRLFDPNMHSIRIVDTESKFNALYNSMGSGYRNTSNTLGVNITRVLPEKNAQGEDKRQVMILINNGLLKTGASPEGFKNPIGDTVTHEFGHTVHNTLEESSFESNSAYAKAYKEYITQYGKSSKSEHFAESFSKYVQLGESTPTFFQFLQSVGLA